MSLFKSASRIAILLGIAILATACMVGPDFHSPPSPVVARFNAKPLPAQTATAKSLGTAGRSQAYVNNQYISDQWWELFHSATINQLVKRGIDHSPNLTAAYATLRQAQENLNAQIGNSLFPAVDGKLNGQRQQYSTSTIGQNATSIFNLFNANVTVSYTLDVFGGARRQIEQLAAQVDYQQFELIAAYLSLTSNIVTTAVTIASLEAQIQTTYRLITEEENLLHIIQQQYRLGGVSEINVVTQATQVAQTRASLPPLQKSLSQNRHALAVLIGTFPDEPMPSINLDALNLPHELPVSLPSNIVRQRPDVRASEALLHAASAEVGVATANLLPQFTLTGAYGWQGFVPSHLIQPNNLVWGYGGGLTQPIFHGGALLAQRRAAIAAYQSSAAQYRQTVLQAFQNVADSLRATETDARTLREQRAAELFARKNYVLTKQQYRLGGVSYLNLLTAEVQYQQTVINRIQAQAARYSDTAALFQALGGGWWNKQWCVKNCIY